MIFLHKVPLKCKSIKRTVTANKCSGCRLNYLWIIDASSPSYDEILIPYYHRRQKLKYVLYNS